MAKSMPMPLVPQAIPHPPFRAPGPHLSGPGGWAILIGFLALTLLGVVLYLVRLAQAAT